MYVKLFNDILFSSIWTEADDVRVVWITLLLMADQDGFVRSTAPGISSASKVSLERTREILVLLESPDPDSRTPDNEGRRIQRTEDGYLVLNYVHYRKIHNEEQRREQSRMRSKDYRDRKAASRYITPRHATSRTRHAASRTCHAKSRQAEAETEAKTDQDPPLTPQGVCESADFDRFWDAYPKKTGKSKALDRWRRLSPPLDAVLKALEWQTTSEQWTREQGRFIPNPARYLEECRWEDKPVVPDGKPDSCETRLVPLQKRVEAMREQIPSMSYSEVIRHVGTPEEIAEFEQRQRAKAAQLRPPAVAPSSLGNVLKGMGHSTQGEVG